LFAEFKEEERGKARKNKLLRTKTKPPRFGKLKGFERTSQALCIQILLIFQIAYGIPR